MTAKLTFSERGGWWVAAQFVLLLVAAVLPPWTTPVRGPFGHPLQIAGVVIAVAAVIVVFAGLVTLGRSLTPFPRPREKGRLVTRGIYALVRHPMYAGVIVGLIGWSLMWLSVAGVVYTAIVALYLDRKAAREERWLRQRFPTYADYAKRVRKFVPGVY